MYKLNDEELEQLKKIEIEIMLEIDRICREHDIKYSLTGGTLLGAVRHQGFIPWDDDIDIMMERRYYERFCQIVDQSINSCFLFVDYKKYEDYGLPFSKVVAKNTMMLEVSSRFADIPHGVWVDIFPIDETSDDLKMRSKQYGKAQNIKSIMLCRGHYDFGKSGMDRVIYACRRFSYQFLDKQSLVKAFERNAKFYLQNPGKYMLSLCGNAGLTKNTYDRTCFNAYIEMEFEGYKLLAISGYDHFLQTTYGDYMTIPPLEEQVTHHYVECFDLSTWKS